MIFIDKVAYTAREVAERFGVPYEKLEKTPEFLINPEDIVRKPGQSAEISIKAGTRVMANIIVRVNGKSIEIRYAESANDRYIGDKLVPEYTPRKITFLGEAQLIEESNMDLAVFMYLHPFNRNSPFRKPTAAYSWYFKDIEAESAIQMDINTALMESMYEISSLSGEPLRIIAKGFGVTGVLSLPDNAIKSQLIEMAKVDPVEFNKNIGSQQTQFRGLILNGIDNGLFVVKRRGGTDTWMWGAGQSAGQPIVDIVDKGVSQSDILIEQILYKITEYYPILVNAVKAVGAKANADEYLANTDLNVKQMFAGMSSAPKVPESEFGGGSSETSDVPVDLSGANDNVDTDDTDDDVTPDEQDSSENRAAGDEDDDFEIPAFLVEKPKPATTRKKGNTNK